MRIVLPAAFAVALALLPANALAVEPEFESDTRRMAEELRDPVRQAQIAGAAEAVTDAVLSMPAAPVLRALAEIAGHDPNYVHPDLRVGDFVGPDAADAPREFAYRLPQMMGAMAGLAVALEDMMPELRARIEDAVPPARGY
jgi:hypothetical protein